LKTIFITGGARGIGLATARLFLDKDWIVGLYDIDDAALQEAKETLNNANVHIFQGSILDETELKKSLTTFTKQSDGALHLLHNNAGILEVGEFDEQELKTHLDIVDVNLKGLIVATHAALPFLKKASNSKIVNMSSASAIYGNPEISVYAATKSAIMSLTEGWNIAFRKFGISVSDILPIYVRTRMVDDYHDKYRKLDLKSVKLTPKNVAQSVWKAVNSRRVHYYVGFETKIYARLVHYMPDAWLPPILRTVLGYKD
jgi:short-subunit dehydrogenase